MRKCCQFFTTPPPQPTHVAYQGSRTHSPQGSVAAADIPLELDKDHMMDAPGETLHTTNRAAMRTLADNRSVRRTTAIRFAGATTTAEATHSWTGRGADYTAWVGALRRDPTSPKAAIHQDAPKRVYLAVINGAKHLVALHHFHLWKALDRGHVVSLTDAL